MLQAACIALWTVLLMRCAWAQQETAGAEQADTQTIHFDIPAQSLRSALQSYISLTELSIMVPSGMTTGRTSAAIHGDYTSREALARLLQGTGLTVHFISDSIAAITVPPGAASSTAAVPTEPSELLPADEVTNIRANGMDYEPYVALIQQEVLDALCASSITHPGDYRLLVQFRVSARGAIADVHVLGSTGMHERDVAVLRVLRSVVLDLPPPLSMPEPVTILFRPQGNGVVTRCPAPVAGS